MARKQKASLGLPRSRAAQERVAACSAVTRSTSSPAAAMLASPSKWKGKTLDCASDDLTGDDVAAALTGGSGGEGTYGVAVPRFVMRCFMKDLNAMIEFFETTGDDADIAAFKAVVPDAQDCKAWFAARGVKSWSEEASSSWF